ncbi:unnamed protein product, partial [Brassica rapa]
LSSFSLNFGLLFYCKSYLRVDSSCRLHVSFCVWGLFFHPPVDVSNRVFFYGMNFT